MQRSTFFDGAEYFCKIADKCLLDLHLKTQKKLHLCSKKSDKKAVKTIPLQINFTSMKNFLICIIMCFVVICSCKTRKPENETTTDKTQPSTSVETAAGNQTHFVENFSSDDFFKPQDNNCPVYITFASEASRVYAYFFVNDKSATTELISIFVDDNGNLFHDECSVKIHSIDLKGNDTISVSYTETKRKFIFKSKKDYTYICVKSTALDNIVKGRYKKEIFTDYAVISDIKYGSAKGYWSSFSTENNDNYVDIIKNQAPQLVKSQKKLDLLLDIYYPEGDYLDKRPLIMLIHGGGYFVGDKKNSFMLDMCPYFAKCGYTVVSIDYRMGFVPSQANIDRIGYQAFQDARAAMRFLVRYADKYQIDTSMIYVAGTSAGAIMALNMAFLDEPFIPESANGGRGKSSLGGLDDSGNKYNESFDIKAVVNMWGAVHDSAMISPEKEVALLSVHGNADMVVPFDYANPFMDAGKVSEWVTNKVCGSNVIHRRAKANNYANEKLIVIPGAGHGPVYDKNNKLNSNYYMIKGEMTTFLHNVIGKNLEEIELDDLNISFNKNHIEINPNFDVVSRYHINLVGGCITYGKKNNFDVVWFSNATERYYEFNVVNKIGVNKVLKLYVND